MTRSPHRLLVLLGIPALWSVAIACGSSDAPPDGGAAGSPPNAEPDASTSDGGAAGDANDAGDAGGDGSIVSPVDAGDAGDGSCPFQETVATRLSVDQSRILDPSGAPIQLRGWNWGQWGTVQPGDGADNLHQGANVVRIPLRWWGEYDSQPASTPIGIRTDSRIATYPYIDPGHLAQLDATIAEAVCQGLWVDLFVDSDCGQGSLEATADYCGSADGGVASFANAPDMAAQFTQLWLYLVDRYRSQPRIAMYELLPEPNFDCRSKKSCTDWGDAPAFYTPLASAIRAVDAITPLLVGPNGGYEESQIATAYIPGITGLIYTVDLLEQSAQDPGGLAAVTSFRSAKNVPIFVQQVGIEASFADAGSATGAILSALDDDGIGWTWWTYREKSLNAGGYSPFYGGGDGTGASGPWQEDAPMLAEVTSYFQR